MFWGTSAYSSSLIKNRAAKSTSQPPTIHRNSFNGAEERTTTEGGLLRPDKGRQLRWSRYFATRHAHATKNGRRMVVGTGRLYPIQTGLTSFQETTRHRGWSTSAVASRSRRSVEVEKGQRRYGLSPHDDRRLLERGLVCSYEEQVRDVVGSSADNHVQQRLAKHVADRSRTGISV